MPCRRSSSSSACGYRRAARCVKRSRRRDCCRSIPEIDLAKNKLGVFAKLSKPDAVLRDHDRVEIYRPLLADPKEVRKQRAAAGKVMKKGAGESEAE
jgi:putative ubiquitin-RnfH superfamily antitoxin RatB of RatAB toxin-antitoxin module